MSTAEASRRPVELFLGAGASRGGPFALLGLDPARCDRDAVAAALERQLARIGAHPQGQTPSADEVRLALHAAAAQLMDPAVRQSMRARWAAGGVAADEAAMAEAPRAMPPVASAPPAASAPVPAVPSPVDSWPAPIARPSGLDPAFEAEARALIAMAGGPGPEALVRIAALAKARGVPPSQVPTIVKLLAASPAGAGAAPAASSVPAVRPRPSVMQDARPAVSASATGGPSVGAFEPDPFTMRERDDSAGALKTVAIFSVLGLLLMAGAFYGVLVMTAPTGPAPAPQREPESLTGHIAEADEPSNLFPRGPEGSGATTEDEPAAAALDSAKLVEEFRAAIAAQSVDPAAAAAAFAELNRTAGADWPRIPIDRRRAIVDLVVEYVYRAASTPDGPVPVLEGIAEGATVLAGSRTLRPEEVGRASWSVGLLVRLQRERDISARAGSLIEARLGAALDGVRPVGASAFDAGAAAALGAMPRHLVPAAGEPIRTRESIDQRLEAWTRWLRAIDAVAGTDAAARTGLILGGMEVLIRDAGEPTDDRVIFESIGLLVEAMDFSEGSAARAWLVRTLDAPGVSTGDAHALLNAVATRSPAGRLDVSMVLGPRATDLKRREMRDRLAILWNLADPADRDALASAWREAWANASARLESDLTPLEHLASAVVLSRVSEAALLRWRGLTSEAESLLDSIDGDIDATLSPATNPASAAGVQDAGDGVWADRYLQAGRSIPIRLDLLQSAAGSMSQQIGPVDAEVLLAEAVRGSPAAVQQAAYDIVMRLLGSPSIVNALLEELPTMPKTRRTAALVTALTGARLPIMRDKRWEVEARRAAVTRLLELLAADGEMRVYDDLSRLLAASYVVRNETAASSGGPGYPGITSDPPEFAAGVLRSRWRRQAEPLLPPPALGLSLDEIERRRASRLELAEGPVQTFAAEQLAAVELMALVVASEQPDQVEPVRVILNDLARARQRARHITEQIAAGEAAGAALWGVRLKEGAAP